MKCKDCREGRRITARKVMCITYGMIIGAEHEYTRKGGRRHESGGDEDHGESQREATGIPKDGSGAA